MIISNIDKEQFNFYIQDFTYIRQNLFRQIHLKHDVPIIPQDFDFFSKSIKQVTIFITFHSS